LTCCIPLVRMLAVSVRCFYYDSAISVLYSFPTRRSSDLVHFLLQVYYYLNRLVPHVNQFHPLQIHLTIVCNLQLVLPMIFLLDRSEELTSELQSRFDLVCRLLLEKKTKYMQSVCQKKISN